MVQDVHVKKAIGAPPDATSLTFHEYTIPSVQMVYSGYTVRSVE